MSALDGATTPPEPGYRVANAGEFAARWNSLTEEERDDWVRGVGDAFDRSARCFQMNHSAEIEHLRRSRGPVHEEWAVEVAWGDNHRYIQYESEEACHRFIRTPPLWFDLPDGEATLSVVRRLSATPWARPTDEPVARTTFEDRFADAIRRDQETGALPKPTTETPIHGNGSRDGR